MYTQTTAFQVSDVPSEKISQLGRSYLSDAELLSLLISGNSSQSAALSRQILEDYKNNLSEVKKMTISDWLKYKGISMKKAKTLVAAFELGRRAELHTPPERIKICSSQDAYDIFRATGIQDEYVEHFCILMLNRANKVLGIEKISTGGAAGTVVDTKVIFKKALEKNASSIILCHNHPSGTLRPSQQDLTLTKNLTAAGKFMDIPIIDHMILTSGGYVSLADEGYL
jgi:DNA repair protein RadC